MTDFGETVPDTVLGAYLVEGVSGQGGIGIWASLAAIRELSAIIGQAGVEVVQESLDDGLQQVNRRGLLMKLGATHHQYAVDGDEHVQLALYGADDGEADVA